MCPRRGATSLVRDRSCFSHLMPTHGSWVHVTYLKNVATILLHSGISTAYTVVKVVFGVGREYDNFRSRSLQQPNVIITSRSFKIIYTFKTISNNIIFHFKHIYFQNHNTFKVITILKHNTLENHNTSL